MFERHAARLRPRLLSIASSMLRSDEDAEDAVQEALLKLWFFRNNLAVYDSIDAPAVIILRRVCINTLRSKSRSPLSLLSSFSSLQEKADDDATDDSLSDDMLSAINALPSTEQAVLRLRHIDGMEIDEIASLTASTPGAVRTALSRARKRVRDHFTNIYKSNQPR